MVLSTAYTTLDTNWAYHLDYRYCRDQGNQSAFGVYSPKRDRCFAYCNEQSDRHTAVCASADVIIH